MTYRTSEIARIVNVHPNTVRLYESYGHISHFSRDKNGYRIYTEKHLEEMKIARIAFPGPFPVSSRSLYDCIKCFISEDYTQALDLALKYKTLLLEERKMSLKALAILDQWQQGKVASNEIIAIGRKAFAKCIGLSVETIRTWERNRLYQPSINTSRNKQYSELDYENLPFKASDYLTKLYKNSESTYEACEWMTHIETHIKRIKKIISILNLK